MNRQERVHGCTGASGMIQALATGYLLWDLFKVAPNVDIFGVGTLAHAISALTIYLLGFVSSVIVVSSLTIRVRLPS